jgi:NAD(P)-dependent dehydrogenase (short-subunit alcohol dehydrogenase family)
MRNLASCHRAAYDTQPIMVERRPFVPQGAIAAVRSERMGGCPAPRRCMKCHLHSLDLRQSERVEIAAGNVPYAAAKGGVNAITASLAMEYAAHGIRVCGVAPGGTEAPPRRIPRNAAEPSVQEKEWTRQVVDQTISSSLMKRYGTTEEQAAAILFLGFACATKNRFSIFVSSSLRPPRRESACGATSSLSPCRPA